jgi:hypothetical protein
MKIEDLKGKNLKSFKNLMQEFTLTTMQNEEDFEKLNDFVKDIIFQKKKNKGEVLYIEMALELISLYDELNPI